MNSGEPNPADVSDAAVKKTERALTEAFAQIQTPQQAEKAARELESRGREGGNAEKAPMRELTERAPRSAEAIRAAVSSNKGIQKPVAAVTEAAQQLGKAGPRTRDALDEAVLNAANDGRTEAAEVPPASQHGRNLLRQALMREMHPADAVDAEIFLAINGLPHPKLANAAMLTISEVMTAGDGWLLLLLALSFSDRKRDFRALRAIVPALWLATATVEIPIKHFFRRKRPFVSLVRAIVVGRKPGSYSFPSGHSAAAFGGAALMSRYYPRGRPLFALIAGLVGFSRVYLGAHYPGDVITGAISGTALAEFYHALLGRNMKRKREPFTY